MNHFANLGFSTPDEMNSQKMALNNDTLPMVVDVSAGVLRNDEGGPYLFQCVQESESLIHQKYPQHDYNYTTGIPEFVHFAQTVAFGSKADTSRIASVQTVAGTSACHLAFEFLSKVVQVPGFHVGMPAWPNYVPQITAAHGSAPEVFQHYSEETKQVDFESVEKAMQNAACGSVFVLQTVCHNPTGADYSVENWDAMIPILKARSLLVVLDSAYLGFGSGDIDTDAYPIRRFYEEGLQFLVCQSFSKNLGLYGERVGALHVVAATAELAPAICDNIRSIIRREYSSSPAYGARLAMIIGSDKNLSENWKTELRKVTKELRAKRTALFQLLEGYNLGPQFSTLLRQQGLFWYSGLTAGQCKTLQEKYHIYLPVLGRVNVAGLNASNIEYFAKSILEVATQDSAP